MKNKSTKLILSVFLFFAVLSFTNAQKKTDKVRDYGLNETPNLLAVKGTVTSFNNYYVNNALVTSRKTKSSTFSDSLGRFEIISSFGDDLVFRANGFEKNRREVTANDDEISVNMILIPGKKNQEKAVNYGHMHEQDVADGFEQYSNNYREVPLYSCIKDLLQAELLGARIVDQGSIQVYTWRSNISTTGLSGNNGAAVFVLNGMIVCDIDDLNPREVRTIKLLKGHEATWHYGSKGLNGVVLIDTK